MQTPVDIHRWLEENQVPFESHLHSPRFTAQEVAEASRVTGYELAKVIVVRADGRFVMAVLPAPRRLSLPRLAEVLGVKEVRLATEEEFAPLFPGCEKGAMPPFGEIYGIEMILDRSVARHPEVAFNACTHSETLTVRWTDYERVAHPRLADIVEPSHSPP